MSEDPYPYDYNGRVLRNMDTSDIGKQEVRRWTGEWMDVEVGGGFVEYEDHVKALSSERKKLDGYIETNAFITKRFDENYEAYKALKKKLEEKDELLEKIRPLLDQGSIVHNTGMMLRFRQDCREAIELLNKTMPKKSNEKTN